jgi:ubiquinone/menaquinone biosynthesis C-methylase UbiE
MREQNGGMGMAKSAVEIYYKDPKVVNFFRKLSALKPVETALLSRFRDELQDQPVLDIGIGGGRTTAPLLEITRSYIGIDFSKEMILAARQKFPEADLLVCDARDLSMFKDGQFAAVFFWGGGLDDIVADRSRVLKEINRVLGSGIFMLMTHNFDANNMRRYLKHRLQLSRDPSLLIHDNLLRLRSYVSYCYNWFWSTAHHRGYAIYREYEESYGDRSELGRILPTYYMNRDAQVRQLMERGFSEVEAFDQNGNTVERGRAAKDLFLFYVARKRRN